MERSSRMFLCLFYANTLWSCRMSKLRLFVRSRKQGSRIESVPLKQLIKLSGLRKRRWTFKDGWLILEAS